MLYTEIKEYEGYVNLSESELRNLTMFHNDVIAHAQLDANKIRESMIATNTKIKIVSLNAEEVERERQKIECAGIIYSEV